jgi:prepilin-type N-terminal cleavage/methylation domain-containing protein
MNKLNNKGVSLVELIVVMAIMSVLIGTVSYGISFSSGKQAEECARKIESTLEAMRTASIGKYEITGVLSYDENRGYVFTETVKINSNDTTGTTTETIVGNKNVKVYFGDGSADTELTASNSITFQFSRSTSGLTEGCTNLKITKANKTMNIEIAKLTGKVSISS